MSLCKERWWSNKLIMWCSPYCLECLSCPASCLMIRIWRFLCMTTTYWAGMKKWVRQSLIWRTDFCPVSGPAVACHKRIVCKYEFFVNLFALAFVKCDHKYHIFSTTDISYLTYILWLKWNELYKALLVPFSYSSGINQWRDQLKPSEILGNVARVRGIPPPNIERDGTSVSLGGKLYNLQDFGTACHSV